MINEKEITHAEEKPLFENILYKACKYLTKVQIQSLSEICNVLYGYVDHLFLGFCNKPELENNWYLLELYRLGYAIENTPDGGTILVNLEDKKSKSLSLKMTCERCKTEFQSDKTEDQLRIEKLFHKMHLRFI